MPDETDLVRYYDARASEYEQVYAKPERQGDLALLHQVIPEYFDGRHVLEVACGTGYWTRSIATRAAAITGCDLADEVLALARQLQPADSKANFVRGDAFALQKVGGKFDAAFVGFWWSHVLRVDRSRFVRGLHEQLSPGSRVLIADNRFVTGSNTPIARTDDAGNTYQQRTLTNGDVHEVLKNFPTAAELQRELAAKGGLDVQVHALQYFWYASYTIA